MKNIIAVCDHCGKKIQEWKEYSEMENNKINKSTDFGISIDLCSKCDEEYEDEKNKYFMYYKAFQYFTYKFIGREKELERNSGGVETPPTGYSRVTPPTGANHITTTNSRYRGDVNIMRQYAMDRAGETTVETDPIIQH